MRLWLFVAGLNGTLAVMAGAYGWHWLEAADSGLRDIFMMAVQYQMWHALALLAVAWLAGREEGKGTVVPHVAGGRSPWAPCSSRARFTRSGWAARSRCRARRPSAAGC